MNLTPQFYIISDLHLGHANIIKYCGRPEENNELIIKNWNKIVGKKDNVLCLGDLTLANKEKSVEMCKQLKGRKYLVRGNHDGHCFSEKTRLLTNDDGYKKYSELKIGQTIPTVNLKTNKVEYNPIKNIFIYNNVDFLYKAKHRSIDIEVTGHHVMVYQSAQTKIINKWKKNIAENLWEMGAFRIPICFGQDNIDITMNDDWLRLLGWILTDGSITSRGEIYIYQSKPKGIKKIKTLLKKLYFKYTIRVRNRKVKEICGKKIKSYLPQYTFFINSKNAKKFIRFFSLTKDKNISPLLWYLSDRQFRILLNAIIDGDGTINQYGTASIWGKKEFLEKLLGLCVIHNVGANLIKQKTRNNYYLSIYKDIKHKQIAPKHKSKIKYNGKVWCVNIENHVIFTELNGKPYVSGNSVGWYKDCGFTVLEPIYRVFHNKYDKRYHVLFTHEPVLDIKWLKNWFNIHGHIHRGVHREFDLTERHFNVSVEPLDYKPKPLYEILTYFEEILKK